MDSFTNIIRRWPSLQDLADDLGVPYVTAQLMKHRDSIAAEHWEAVVAAAKLRGIDGVTLELLARIKAEKAGRRPLVPRHVPRSASAA